MFRLGTERGNEAIPAGSNARLLGQQSLAHHLTRTSTQSYLRRAKGKDLCAPREPKAWSSSYFALPCTGCPTEHRGGLIGPF